MRSELSFFAHRFFLCFTVLVSFALPYWLMTKAGTLVAQP
jgi:hypothetical protein